MELREEGDQTIGIKEVVVLAWIKREQRQTSHLLAAARCQLTELTPPDANYPTLSLSAAAFFPPFLPQSASVSPVNKSRPVAAWAAYSGTP